MDAELKIIKTQGDVVQLGWDKLQGKGFFTKEIEEALLNREIDLAVHSHKDLPTEPVKGLVIASVSERESPSELLLINKDAVDEKQKFSLKKNAVVGTSSARRKSQLYAWRDDLKLVDLRGNVPTRIQKLRDRKGSKGARNFPAGGYDAILIANAGVSRLDLRSPDGKVSVYEEFHSEILSPEEFIPAPAQGVLAIQIRASDKGLFRKLQEINHPEVGEMINLERKVLNLFEGGCQLPLGVFCEKVENEEGVSVVKVRVAKARDGNSFPGYFYFESKKTEGLAEKIVEKIKGVSPLRVFISRDEKKNDFFKKCLEASGFSVTCRSLIDIKPVKFNKNLKGDWIFFSSKNAVRHYFEQKPDTGNARIGAVGKATADELRKYGKRAEFIGSADDTRMTGKKFSALVGNKTILFPQAKESMKTIQLQLAGSGRVIDLVVYETIKNSEFRIRNSEFDILVFTSPSNVETFFERNRIEPGQDIVAMGDATANALRKYGARAKKMPASFDDLGLVQAVFGI